MANRIKLHNPYHRYGQILKTTFVCLVFCTIFPSIFSQEKNNGIDKILDSTLVKEGAVTTDYIHLYQRALSKTLGGSCPMYPSCSNYGLIVFNERPFWEAMSLTADRLVRCGHEDKYYEQTYAYGKSSLLDYPPYRTPPHKLIYHSPEYLYTDNLHLQDSTQMFINHLINQNKYDLALLEIERAIYFQANDTNYYVKKLLCYDALDKEEEGILDYEQNFPLKIKTNEEVLLKLAKLYYNTGNYGVAAIMGAFSVSFYIGNIFGAGQSADRYNQRIINQGVNKLNITNQFINF